ncbi:MAG: response regulator transcription factor [Hyphomicrobium sp.]|uniref:response regulator transcription factor n=1 Tax=Hyphomicrobium sp. TaxID=82 RepID=UPI001327542C|nr:response regulator transcription factor [Hyphomicrobium sp.]KAB2943268.1 MAG: response regulator transcription factor [Hyphomicrobium sp.]MBZ0210374.1 response regulator transcription factor [Hyphomicrobium sp.]MCZ7594035.1 response regulator transcription factor [Hyphomicrobium sp.]
MIIIVDDREALTDVDTLGFSREGISTEGLAASDFQDWVRTAPDPDLAAVEAFVLGEFSDRRTFPRMIKQRSRAPVLALNGGKSLQETLELFASGVDDVIGDTVHIHEILARIRAIKQRVAVEFEGTASGYIRVFGDGRDPEVAGQQLHLPRRERRILEYLVSNKGRRVTKTQIFNFVYGLFSDEIDENVIESHISKLRKRLRHRLGHDPIDSQRYLGYRLIV